jgi:ABC-2 type transport system permease protein
MTRSLVVALREIRSFLQDKNDLAFSLLLPIAIFALMYGAFGGQTRFNGTAYMVNEDRGSTYSNLFVERLKAVKGLKVEILTSAQADKKLERSDILMALFIPRGFSDKIAAGEPVQLIFKQRGNGGQEGQIVASIIRGIAEELNQGMQVRKQVEQVVQGKDISSDRITVTVQQYLESESQSPVVKVEEEDIGSSPDPVNQFLPGIITMFVLFSVNLTAQTLVDERRKGTLERLITTRLTTGQLFLGKFLANVGRGFIQNLILLALAYAVFQMFTPLSFVLSLLIALVFTAAVSTLGLIIGSIVRTVDQATWIATFVTMLMVMLGGTFFTISKGTALYTASRISLNTYANNALNTIIVQKGSLADAGMDLLVLVGVAVVGLVISRLLFRAVQGGK